MYLINMYILSIISFCNIKQLRNFIIIFILFYLSLIDGIRFETGPDWEPYLLHFSTGEYSEQFEKMYNFLVEIFKMISSNYNLLLFSISFFLYFSLFRKIVGYSKNIISLPILYAIVAPYIGVNRQIISLGILVYSIKYILEKKIIKYILVIIFAASFHISSLLFLICYPISFFDFFEKRNRFKIYMALVIFSIFGWKLFILIFEIAKELVPLLKKYDFYFSYEIKKNNILGVLVRIIEIFIPLSILSYKNINKENKQILNISILSLIFSLLIYVIFGGKFTILVSRGTLIYRSFFLPILYGIVLNEISNKKIKKIFLTIFIILFWNIIFYKSIIVSEFKNQYIYKNIFEKK